MIDFIDFYIKNKYEPNYTEGQIIEEDIINVILQKYKMILFTNKGDILGEPNLGGNLELLLWETLVSEEYIKTQLIEQIATYIPELINMNYSLDVAFAQEPNSFYDTMFIYFKISDYEVYAQFGKSIK